MRMSWLIVIALVWMILACLLAVLIGRAVHLADRHERAAARRSRRGCVLQNGSGRRESRRRAIVSRYRSLVRSGGRDTGDRK
jgi:hypothetical protein